VRVHVPDSHAAEPRSYVGKTYAPELTKAAGRLANAIYQYSSLSLREFEGARARTAEINGCRLCQSWRSAQDVPAYLVSAGIPVEGSIATHGPAPEEDYYLSVFDWRTSPIYSDRERIAIEYAERMGLDPQNLADDEDFWAKMKAAFSDNEIVDLSYCVAAWMGLGRVAHVLGLDDVCYIPRVASQERDLAAA